MIKLGDLKNREYDGRTCIAFTYNVSEKGNKNALFKADFLRCEDPLTWNMLIVLGRTRDADSQVYNFAYTLPKTNLPLELVCAIGLRYFQLYLKEEIQKKTEIDFLIGEITEGM